MALTDHFQRGFIKKVESRSRIEMDLLPDQTAQLNIWTHTNLDLVYLLDSIKIGVLRNTPHPTPSKQGERRREKSDAFLIYRMCEG